MGVKRDACHVRVAAADTRPPPLVPCGPRSDERSTRLRAAAGELEVKVVDPDAAAVDHQKGRVKHEQALPWLKGEQGRGLIVCQVERRRRRRL